MRSKVATRDGWTRVRFGDVVRLSTERCTDPAAAGVDRYVGLEHLEPSDLHIRSWGNVADGVTFTNRFRPGQVLFGKRRAYQRKVAIADFNGICSSDIYVFEPADDCLLPELLPFICQTDGFFKHALKTSAGSLSPRTNWTSLADYAFDLPPIEQQRSLAIVCSRFVALQDGAGELANSAQAVWSSRLVEETRVLCEHHEMVPLTELFDGSPESGHSPHAVDGDTGTYVLGLSCLGPHGFMPVDYKAVDETPATVATRLNHGDLLISRSNTRERVGFCGVFKSDGRPVSFPDTMMRLVPKAGAATAEYLDHILRAPAIRTRLQSMAAGTSASLKKINRSHLADLRVPRPTPDVQAAFVEAMQQSVAICDTVEARRARAKATYTMFLQQALG